LVYNPSTATSQQSNMASYFISDLHLSYKTPQRIQAFGEFMQQNSPKADAIYILGDLFEYWIGEDSVNATHSMPIVEIMKAASLNCPCYFLPGNRDFLITEQFKSLTGFSAIDDETVIDLYGQKTLILHGDSLCTDDLAHQAFRQSMICNKAWHAEFLKLDLAERMQQAEQARMQSNEHKASVSMEIMDVNQDSVVLCFEKHAVTQMIHGHTHRQNTHQHDTNNGAATRYVLGDWDKTSSVLIASESGIEITNQAI
jgi:UDP-2,3-diacylglucosamine hydrolase